MLFSFHLISFFWFSFLGWWLFMWLRHIHKHHAFIGGYSKFCLHLGIIVSVHWFWVILVNVLYTLLFLFMDSWYAYFEAYRTIWLDFDDIAVKHFYLFVKIGVWIDFGLNAWLWWSLCFFSWVWANMYVRQRKNKNVNLQLELLVSRQIDWERKARTITGECVILNYEWTTSFE